MSKDFQVIKLQPGESVHPGENFVKELRPITLYIFPYGSTKNKPSFAFEMVCGCGCGGIYFAQISEEMLSQGLRDAEAMKVLSEQ